MSAAEKPDAAGTKAEFWEDRVGSIRVLEHVRRKRVLYLMWRQDGNWAYHSLAKEAESDGFPTATLANPDGTPLTGRALDRKKKWALAQAEAYLGVLRSGQSTKAIDKPAAPLTLGETWAIVSHPETGQYPADSRHRREVVRELGHAVRILGEDLPWIDIKREQFTRLWRTRIRELRGKEKRGGDGEQNIGIRGAEITVSRLLAVATWLRDRELIPPGAGQAPSSWRLELRNDWIQLADADSVPEPERPRLTAADFRKLFDATWEVDPRLGLMYALGAELRGGQIKRALRSNLDVPAIDEHAGDAQDFGRLKSPGRGRKKGTVVVFTRGQRAAVDRAMDPVTGYLRELEAAYRRGELKDYFLFPAGQLPGNRTRRGVLPGNHPGLTTPGATTERDSRTPAYPVATVAHHTKRHIGDSAWVKWFKRAEKKAGIATVKGRVWYGARRVGVDLANEAGISRLALQEHGGWSDTQVPDSIYADKDREYARKEAADVRARIRGEPTEQTPPRPEDGE